MQETEYKSENVVSPSTSFDVIISGGGLSGVLTALSLLALKKLDGSGLSIALIEVNNATHAPESVFDDRVLALSHASVNYLKILNVWPLLKAYAQPIKNIHISDRGYYGKARITATEHNVSAVGYVIEMSKIGGALNQTLANKLKESLNIHSKSTVNVTWFTPDRIQHIEWQSDVVKVSLASSTSLSAKLLVGCDGAQSVCRKFANISVDESTYGQSALIANVATSLPHNGIAYERFTEHGPIALLPLVQLPNEASRCSLVWTLSPEEADAVLNLPDDEFQHALEKAFGHWLGEIKYTGKRHVYPLTLVRAQEQVHHRMVLIGNASHTIHPIAGQGFNLGLRDVQALSNAVAESLSTDEDIGSLSRLFEYANSRKKDHDHIITLTDSLVTVFSNKLPPLIMGRNIGLKVLNYVPSIKKAFVSKTMGY
jgi:2-octaprenyl-6-methoxyphenol hydroxylase